VVKGTIVARDASTGWVMVAIQSDRFPEGLMSTHDPDVLSTDLYPIGVKGAVKSARSLSVKLCAESCERAAKAATILGLSTTEREDLLRSGWEKLSTTERVTLQKTYGQKGGVPVSLDSLVALWAKRDQSSEAVAARAKAREAAKAARDAFRRAYPSGVDAFIPEREAARVATQAREDERAVKAARVAATASAASPVVQSPTATPGAVKVTTATPGATTTTPGAVKVPRKSKAALAGR
jgi:hypothetical protein